MNNYYVDPFAASGGTGSLEAPYKSVTTLIAAGITHPCTIWIKRGTTLVESASFGLLLENNSGELSYIRPYGSGRRPKWVKPSVSSSHITTTGTRNLIITGLDFLIDDDSLTPNNGGGFVNLVLRNTTSADIDSNVWIEDCRFKGGALTRSGIYGGNKTVYIRADNANTKRVNKFGVRDCKFKNLSRGVQLQGIDIADDNTDNRTGTYYSRGVKVERCSFVGMSHGAVCFVCVESKNSAYTDDEYQSVARKCTYSSYRWDRYDGTAIRVDAAFWTYHCNRVMFERLIGGGMQPTEADSEFIDFDGLSWDCVARYIISYNNGAGSLWISTAAQARAAYADYSSTYTEFDWFYTRRNGTGNNVIEYSIFYNDGNQRSDKNGSDACAYHRVTTYSYNCIVRKCVHINMTAVSSQYMLANTLTSSGATLVKLEDCIFFWKYLTSTNLVSQNPFTPSTLDIKNCVVYSLAWDSAAITTVTNYLASIATLSGMIFNNPQFVSLPTQPFVSMDSALNLRLKPTSPCIGAGANSSATVDINGNNVRDIFWRAV